MTPLRCVAGSIYVAINALMGNIRWVRRALRRATRKIAEKPSASGRHGVRFIEIGAGDGRLCRKISAWFPGALVTGLDLAPRPSGLPRAISWRQGDLFDELPSCVGEALVGVLILHHFPDESLIGIGRMLRDYRVVVLLRTVAGAIPPFLGCPDAAFLRQSRPGTICTSALTQDSCPENCPGCSGWKVGMLKNPWTGAVRCVCWHGKNDHNHRRRPGRAFPWDRAAKKGASC